MSQILWIVATALLSSLTTLGLGCWLFQTRVKPKLLEEAERQLNHHLERAVDEIGREVETRVQVGVRQAVASLPSTEVLAGAGRTAAKSGVDLVSSLLRVGRKPEDL